MTLSEEALALIPDREWKREEDPNEFPSYRVLDHGYVSVKLVWGSDQEIIRSARMSTDKGFLGWGPREDGKPGDEKLLKYLYENKHSTPFEFAGLTVEVQAPLMVFREWHRHRTQSYSEMSARYVQMPNLHYVPSVERIIASSRKQRNRQASGAGELRIPGAIMRSEEDTAREIRRLIQSEQARIYAFYDELLSFGVAKEVARLDTPVSRYSRMRATTDLRNWLAFLTLRMDPHAQFEIRQYAWCIADAIATAFPRTYELFFKDMLPMFEPELAPKRLLSDTLKALDNQEATHGTFGSWWWHETVEPLKERIRRALGR